MPFLLTISLFFLFTSLGIDFFFLGWYFFVGEFLLFWLKGIVPLLIFRRESLSWFLDLMLSMEGEFFFFDFYLWVWYDYFSLFSFFLCIYGRKNVCFEDFYFVYNFCLNSLLFSSLSLRFFNRKGMDYPSSFFFVFSFGEERLFFIVF